MPRPGLVASRRLVHRASGRTHEQTFWVRSGDAAKSASKGAQASAATRRDPSKATAAQAFGAPKRDNSKLTAAQAFGKDPSEHVKEAEEQLRRSRENQAKREHGTGPAHRVGRVVTKDDIRALRQSRARVEVERDHPAAPLPEELALAAATDTPSLTVRAAGVIYHIVRSAAGWPGVKQLIEYSRAVIGVVRETGQRLRDAAEPITGPVSRALAPVQQVHQRIHDAFTRWAQSEHLAFTVRHFGEEPQEQKVY